MTFNSKALPKYATLPYLKDSLSFVVSEMPMANNKILTNLYLKHNMKVTVVIINNVQENPSITNAAEYCPDH